MRHPWDQRLGVWSIAEDKPDLPAIIDSPSGRVLNYRELAGSAHQLVHALRSHSIGTRDIVALALPNDVDIVLWQLAASESGMRSLALNPALSASEITEIVDHSGASVIVAHAQTAERAEVVSRSESVRLKVSVGGEIAGFVAQSDLVNGHPITSPADRTLGGPVSYSSGTTGKPNGIWRPLPEVDPSDAADAHKIFARAFQFRPFGGPHLVSAGMHHGGCQSFYTSALHVGQPLVIMGRFDAESALQRIQRHGVTTAYMVPTQFVRLLRLPDLIKAASDVSSLEVVVHSAAPCPVDVKWQMIEWWGPVIWETYGGMEGAATIAKPHRWVEKPGTVGRAVRGMSVDILDDDGNHLPSGEPGHVYMQPDSGPTFEYSGEPGLTESAHRGRAFTIGDIGFLDEDGYLFLLDRAKDMIISGGVNIYPAEIEAVLTGFPAVADVAVIGAPDDEWGESVKAVVELVEDVEPSTTLADELIAYAGEHLASFKCPRSVEFRDTLPRTEAGKLFKRLLRDEAAERDARQE